MKRLAKLKLISKTLSLLYIENNIHLQEKVYKYFKPIFNDIFQAYDGIDGLVKYQQNKPDIIITSLNLSKKNAFEMIVEIQSMNQNAKVIVLSERNDTFELLEILDLGIIELLPKPINLEKLNTIIENTILLNFNNQEINECENIITHAIKKNNQVTCINNYKGLVLQNHAQLLTYKNDCFTIKVNNTQFVSAIFEKKIIVNIDKTYIFAELLEADKSDKTINFTKPKIITYQQRDSANKRIEVDKNFKTSITHNSKHFEPIPLDVSYKYIALQTNEILDIKQDDIIELTIGFEINSPSSIINEKQFTKIFATGKIIRIDNLNNSQKLIVELFLQKSGESVFKKYIQQRELDIINEFKKRMKI